MNCELITTLDPLPVVYVDGAGVLHFDRPSFGLNVDRGVHLDFSDPNLTSDPGPRVTRIRETSQSTPAIDAGAGCVSVASPIAVDCTGATSFTADLGEGPDGITTSRIDLSHPVFSLPMHVNGNGGADTLDGGAGDDYLDGGAAGDFLVGNGGNDDLVGSSGADEIVGDDGNDHLVGGAGADVLYGYAGNDVLDAQDGASTERDSCVRHRH